MTICLTLSTVKYYHTISARLIQTIAELSGTFITNMNGMNQSYRSKILTKFELIFALILALGLTLVLTLALALTLTLTFTLTLALILTLALT